MKLIFASISVCELIPVLTDVSITLVTYTELVVTENESMHHNIEFTHHIKVCFYLKANKAHCINLEQKYTSGVRTYTYLGIVWLIMSTYKI